LFFPEKMHPIKKGEGRREKGEEEEKNRQESTENPKPKLP